MKVLFVHDGPMLSNPAKTVYYGVHYTDEIVERYAYFGKTVTFLMRNNIISEKEFIKYTPLQHEAFQFIEVPNFKSISSKFRQMEAKAIIKKAIENHDIIIVRLPSANGVIAKKIAEKLGKPVLVEVVACVFDALWNYDWRGKLLAHYKMYQYKKHVFNSSHVIYVTEKFLQERYPTIGKSIACSDVVLKHFDNTILEKRLQKIDKQYGKVTLGTVAAIDVPYKGQADVIQALYQLKSKEKLNFYYKIVGQGSPDRLRNLVQNLKLDSVVEIVGSLPHDRIFDFIDSLDLYIQPSKQEGLPRSVIEALSRGCPVLATNIAGHPELIDKEALFEAGKVGQIKDLISYFHKLPLKVWAKNNFERAKNFKIEILNERRMAFYDSFKTFAEKATV